MKSLFSANNHLSVAPAPRASEDSHGECDPARGANHSTAQVRNASPLRALPDGPKLLTKARHQFTREYKLKILDQADSCQDADQVNMLLRREGLCRSDLLLWREQQKRGILTSLTSRKRDRQLDMHSRLIRENEQLKIQNQRLSKRLGDAEVISEFQTKLVEALGILLKNRE
jgi:hypothetical protein